MSTVSTQPRGVATILNDACKLYCGWYDHGEPAMDGGAIAHELVDAIRLALREMGDESDETEQPVGMLPNVVTVDLVVCACCHQQPEAYYDANDNTWDYDDIESLQHLQQCPDCQSWVCSSCCWDRHCCERVNAQKQQALFETQS